MDFVPSQVKKVAIDIGPEEKIQDWASVIEISFLVPERDVEKLRKVMIKLLSKEN